MLVDTSGTYAQEAGKAQVIINYLLGSLQPAIRSPWRACRAAASARRTSSPRRRSIRALAGERAEALRSGERIENSFRAVSGSRYTDITGGLIQGAEFLNETGAGSKTIIIFSDMQEELDKVTQRDFPISLKGIRVVAVNVVKLKTDNIDPRKYMGRLEAWQKRVETAGAREWRVINNLDRLDAILARG
jgi:hypothetical protein